jgi:hypothetical protein
LPASLLLKGKPEGCPVLPNKLGRTVPLVDQHRHDLDLQGIGVVKSRACRKPDAAFSIF